jgi:hypothetical protein
VKFAVAGDGRVRFSQVREIISPKHKAKLNLSSLNIYLIWVRRGGLIFLTAKSAKMKRKKRKYEENYLLCVIYDKTRQHLWLKITLDDNQVI